MNHPSPLLAPVYTQFLGIQLLRFWAAMLVVVMHLTQSISIHHTGGGGGDYWHFGSSGVDIFFVISGFVMASSTRNLPADPQRRMYAAWAFMRRRILRVVPLYWFYTLLKVLLLLAVPSLALRTSLDLQHLVLSLLFIPAFSPWGLVEPVLPVGWTLNFEMFFYAVFAVAIAFGRQRIQIALLLFLLIFLMGQFTDDLVILNFYASSMIFEFMLGAGISHFYASTRTPPPWLGLPAIAAGLILLFGIHWDVSTDRFTTWGLGAGLIVIGTIWLEPWISKSQWAGRLAFLGDASYTVYLSHTFVVPAGVVLFKVAGLHNSWLISLSVGLAVVVSGCALYVLIEKPLGKALKQSLNGKPNTAYPTSGESHAK
jgi:peptidoglycan/LPS O-acetylase OafA/YrhL